MDLAQLKEGLTNGTRSAEQYLQKFGTDVMSALKQTVTVLEPEEEQKDEENNYSASQTALIPLSSATRKDALLAKMQDNPATYLEEPSAKDTKVLDTFNSTFHIEEYTDEIAQLLNDYPNLREMMDRLVPVQVSYPLFWQRYFYHAWNIEQDEKKRQLIVQQPNEDDADFKWDSDEDDNVTVKEDSTKQKQRSSEDTDDFSHISSNAASPPPGKTDDDWVKAEKKPSDEEEEESDNYMSSEVLEEHVDYCFGVLEAHLKQQSIPEPSFQNNSYPLFITWHKKTEDGLTLRGCIGNFKPMPLHEGLKDYALISALRDYRFSPITLSELPLLTCAVSLLVNFEKAEDYLDWEIGVHGIWIEFTRPSGGKNTATYLPEVMQEQGWTKEEAIESLLRKGGYRDQVTREYCLKHIVLTRFQSRKLEKAYSSHSTKRYTLMCSQ
ncbi:AMMECR1 domain-containing protein [Choanephora cucurbitarum]|nr:AMMECR1 domain-containing protein [Choanephora cucurbitarum]